MNANELADELEGFGYLNSDDGLHFCPFQAQVDMLRQLHAENQALKKQLKAACSQLMDMNLGAKK